ncbi:MAG TPA: rhodanese-like domain-containing protein [Polyangiaceae bacterium]|nr:rhodanese-like domain-containing protein [Polyangiaceae bacterium]
MESLYLGPVLPPNEVRTIEREELKLKLAAAGGLRLVMCRPEREFQTKRIAGSVHFNTRDEMLAGLKRDDEIVLYCTNIDCLASQVVYRLLTEHGYTNVRRYAAGLVDWEDAGLPLEGTGVTT